MSLSCRNDIYTRWPDVEDQSITIGTGELKKSWRTLIETFPDRVLFGLDLGPMNWHEQVEETVACYRAVLDSLDTEVAEAIAEGSMERLMGLD
jgi:predicted TIM-barrel fold metal-dependent hydrolase